MHATSPGACLPASLRLMLVVCMRLAVPTFTCTGTKSYNKHTSHRGLSQMPCACTMQRHQHCLRQTTVLPRRGPSCMQFREILAWQRSEVFLNHRVVTPAALLLGPDAACHSCSYSRQDCHLFCFALWNLHKQHCSLFINVIAASCTTRCHMQRRTVGLLEG